MMNRKPCSLLYQERINLMDVALGRLTSDLVLLGGGIVVLANGEVIAESQLEIGGLITQRPVSAVAAEAEQIEDAARSLGYSTDMPEKLHQSLSFLSLPLGRELRFSDQGYIGHDKSDGNRLVILPLIMSER